MVKKMFIISLQKQFQKHALENSLSTSFHDPLQFDQAQNEIVLIGTDVDRIIGVRNYFD